LSRRAQKEVGDLNLTRARLHGGAGFTIGLTGTKE